MVGPTYANGVWHHPAAQFVPNPQMGFPNTYRIVQDADVVVGGGTVAALAVAVGKPLVMVGEDDFADYIGGEYRAAAHPDLYRDLCRYPLNAADGSLAELILTACTGSPAIAEWRRLWTPEDGTTAAIALLEKLAGVSSSPPVKYEKQNATITGVPVRARTKMR